MTEWTYFHIISILGIAGGGWVSYQYLKKRINQYILTKIREKIDSAVATTSSQDFFRPVHTNSAVITFTSGGKQHQIFVPYNRKKSTRCLGQKVFLIKDGQETEITQKPGVPFTVCANDLGGQQIVVKNREDAVIKRFSSQEIPHLF